MKQKKFWPKCIVTMGIVIIFSGCSENIVPSENIDEADYLSGGETTVFNETSQAFAIPIPSLSGSRLEMHLQGDADFEVEFVKSPGILNPGLGPIFNSNSCVSCHPNDGRGRPPASGGIMESMFFRVSLSGTDENGGPVPVPGYGLQLQQKALFNVPPEAESRVIYSEQKYEFDDGESYYLRIPHYTIENSYQSVSGGLLISPRVAPPIFGRGLLEAISEETLQLLADENDMDDDGISGKINYVWDPVSQQTVIGRFGLKANNPSLFVQTAGAYHQDIGITNPLFKMESAHGQAQHDNFADDPEIDMETLQNVTFYTQTLSVPARRNLDDPDVKKGEQIFIAANCISCHVRDITTGILPGVSEVSNQKINPYSDMLLHDMGDGLADDRPDFLADGNEWRTPPLWGIGLTEIVNGHTFFLHDGRARSLMEAVMWHGGEAQASKEYISALSKKDRERLIAFLTSL